MANEVVEAVRTLLAVRQYADREIPEDIVRRSVEAGRLTASGSNAQPWHFILVRQREALRKLGGMVRTGPYTATAAAAVIVAYEKDKGEIGRHDASRAIHAMMLSACGDGIASDATGVAGRLEA